MGDLRTSCARFWQRLLMVTPLPEPSKRGLHEEREGERPVRASSGSARTNGAVGTPR